MVNVDHSDAKELGEDTNRDHLQRSMDTDELSGKSSGKSGKRPLESTPLARIRNGSFVSVRANVAHGVTRRIGLGETNALYRRERQSMTRRVVVFMLALVVIGFISLGIMGGQGQYYAHSHAYAFYGPVEVFQAVFFHAKNMVAEATHLVAPDSNQWLTDNIAGYWAIPERAKVLAVTLICGVLLSVSGMLYQSVFRNPIAGPGLLGVTTGTSFGVMVLVAIYGSMAPVMLTERYALCYGCGALILVFVMLIGRKMSGPVRSLDVVSMLLIGSIVSQLFGLVISYVTLFVFDETTYNLYFTISQMLVVDTSPLTWACLGIACAASIVPVFLLRHHMGAVAFDEEEVRLWGLNYKRLRFIALICGAIMILAASIHIGGVGLVSLVIPFLSRRWFGCQFSHQLAGNFCIGAIFILLCRDLADLVPFVGDGLAIGNVVSLVALPVFLLVIALQQRRMEDQI